MSKYQQQHTFNQLPGLLEYFGFVFAFGNLLAGPVIEFRDYQMWVNKEGPWSANAGRKVPFWGDMRAVRDSEGRGLIKSCQAGMVGACKPPRAAA